MNFYCFLEPMERDAADEPREKRPGGGHSGRHPLRNRRPATPRDAFLQSAVHLGLRGELRPAERRLVRMPPTAGKQDGSWSSRHVMNALGV